jgi:hypothetical protein
MTHAPDTDEAALRAFAREFSLSIMRPARWHDGIA